MLVASTARVTYALGLLFALLLMQAQRTHAQEKQTLLTLHPQQQRVLRAERGEDHYNSVDQKLRHRPRKKTGITKGKKLRLSGDMEASHGTYGISLPAFAFDYSEYLAGAVIERSSLSDNLYLTMFFVGHRTVAHDWPFDAMSTAEEVLYSWYAHMNVCCMCGIDTFTFSILIMHPGPRNPFQHAHTFDFRRVQCFR